MTTRRRIAPVLLAAGLLIGGCRGSEPPPTGPIRLLEQRTGAVVHWPDPDRPVPAKLLDTVITDLPAPGRAARVILHRGEDERDGRVALLAPAGSRYRFELTLPGGRPVLDLALGHALEPMAPGIDLRFLATLRDRRGDEHILLDETQTTENGARWRNRRIPLGNWAGRTVTLELRVEASGGPIWPAWASPEIRDEERVESGYDVILVILDTLRADRLGSYGYERPTSPFLDRWAAENTRFETAVSQSSWTRPSHRSLFSGLYPTSRAGLTSPPLAEVLWRAGYRTRALTGGAQLAYRFGFSRGFEVHRIERWIHDVERVVQALSEDRNRSSFTFLHTYEIHDPYTHRELATELDPGRVGEAFERATLGTWGRDLTDEEKHYVGALYDSGIRYVDSRLEELFARLDEEELLTDTIVVITSDHGEELWDHGGWGHGHAMFEHQTRVPLLVHLPESLRRQRGLEPTLGATVGAPVRLVDLYPTLLDLLGIPLGHPVQGRSIVPLFAGREMPPADALSESTYWGPLEVKGLRGERFKYLRATPKKESSDRPGWASLFDLEADPREMTDVSSTHPERVERMSQLLDFLTSDASEAEVAIPEDLDPELEEQLRALGYIQ